MAREQAEHFWPLNPNALTATPSTAASRSQPDSTRMESLPPISSTVRLMKCCPGRVFAALSWILRPTAFDPVKAMKRVWGWATMAEPNFAPAPGQKLTTPGGRPASSRMLKKIAAMVGASPDGLRITVLPQTMAAEVMPAMIAEGNVTELVALSGILDGRGRGVEAQGFAGLNQEDGDRLALLGVGLGPVLA